MENLDIFDFSLTDDEMAAIAALESGESSFFSFRDPNVVEWFAQLVEERKRQGDSA